MILEPRSSGIALSSVYSTSRPAAAVLYDEWMSRATQNGPDKPICKHWHFPKGCAEKSITATTLFRTLDASAIRLYESQ